MTMLMCSGCHLLEFSHRFMSLSLFDWFIYLVNLKQLDNVAHASASFCEHAFVCLFWGYDPEVTDSWVCAWGPVPT